MAVGEVDGEPAVIALRQDNGIWIPHSIVRVADYGHCLWVLRAATSLVVELS